MATEKLNDLADRWDRLIQELDVLLGESDTARVDVPNICYHAFAALRPLPQRIRDGLAVPLERYDLTPDQQPTDPDERGPR